MTTGMTTGMTEMQLPRNAMKRLVDLIDRGVEDDIFFPISSKETIFRREWPTYHNVVPEIVEISYKGNAAWGQRITVPLTYKDTGDLLSWVCLRLQPRSWLGGDLDAKLQSGQGSYDDSSRAWMWASSLGSIAIQRVELEINETTIESWSGDWMDVWSRTWLDGGRAATWDYDMYAKIPGPDLRTRPDWTATKPTEDGYIYCWFPFSFFRRPASAFPLIAVGEHEVRLHITLRPFHEVVRRRGIPRTNPAEIPLGETIVVNDVTGPSPVPYEYTLPTTIPTFEDATVFVGVVHTAEPLRSAYLRIPFEMMYEPVTHMVFDVADKVTQTTTGPQGSVTMQMPLRNLNGPIREIVWFLRRKAAWRYNEWTNYGTLLEDEWLATLPAAPATQIPQQEPIMLHARVMVDNAIWYEDSEQKCRSSFGLNHRGGVRATAGMVYGVVFGTGAEELQPSATVNASRSTIRLVLDIRPPAPPSEGETGCVGDATGWEVHVFGIGLNWMRFVSGQAVPLFKD
jgi:hypothetical protein